MTNNELTEETIKTVEALQSSWKDSIDKAVATFVLKIHRRRTDVQSLYLKQYIQDAQNSLAGSLDIERDLENLKGYLTSIEWMRRLGDSKK